MSSSGKEEKHTRLLRQPPSTQKEEVGRGGSLGALASGGGAAQVPTVHRQLRTWASQIPSKAILAKSQTQPRHLLLQRCTHLSSPRLSPCSLVGPSLCNEKLRTQPKASKTKSQCLPLRKSSFGEKPLCAPSFTTRENQPAKMCAVEGSRLMWPRPPGGFQAINKTSSTTSTQKPLPTRHLQEFSGRKSN